MIVMDGSIVNVALPTLAIRLAGATNSSLQWVVDAYILSFASLLLIAGSAADRFGRRRMLVVGLATFAAVSVGAALSGTSQSLILWRAAMGCGAAMIFPSTLAIITEDFRDPVSRRTAIAIWAGSSGLGVAVGPVAGGWLLAHTHWGAIFLVNLPVALVAIVGVRMLAHESRDPHNSSFDPIGSGLAVIGVLGLVWGLIEAPERGWLTLSTIASLLGASVLLALFVVWECRTPRPMLDMRYFLNPRFSAGCIAIAAAFFGLFGFVFMVTQYFQFLYGYDALEAGIRTTPFAGFILLGALLATVFERRFGASPIVSGGLILMAAGFAWATRDTLDTTYGVVVQQMGVLGIGLGMVNAVATEVIMASLPINRVGTGSSVNDTLREVGGTLGVAGMGSAFNALYRSRIAEALASAPLPEAAKSLVRSSVGAAMVVITKVEQAAGPAAAQALRARVQSSFLCGFRVSCWIACAAAALGALLVLLIMPLGTAKYAAQKPQQV